MKLYIYAVLAAAVLGVGFWLRWDAVNDFKAKLERAEVAHAVETEKLKRSLDATRKELRNETGKRLAAVKALGVGRSDCYRLDDPLPGDARKLLDPDHR